MWRYPRPPIAEPSDRHVGIEHRGILVADSRAAIRTLETSHPPSWDLPPADLTSGLLRRSERRSFCDWKGHAVSWHLAIGEETLCDVAWSYPEPTPAFAALRDHVAFYAGALDRCTVDGDFVNADRRVESVEDPDAIEVTFRPTPI